MSRSIPASYIEGHFFDPDQKKLIHHIVPCVVHKIDQKPVTLSFLDFSREYYMELIPDTQKISPKKQEFVWKNGFVYQLYKDLVKRKTSTKDGEYNTSCYNVVKIVDYQKEKYLKYFQSKYDELLKNYESWEEITFTYQPLNIEEKLSVVSIINSLKGSDELLKSIEAIVKKNFIKNDKALKKFLKNDSDKLLKFHLQEVNLRFYNFSRKIDLFLKSNSFYE